MNNLHERESKRRAPILFVSLTAIVAGLLIAVGVMAWNSPSTNPPGGGGALNYLNGNIGIGTATPSYPLTVAGTIYSSTGGFRFPDNTTQTTAASAGLGGGGTVNYVGKFTGTGTIGNSLIFDNGTNVGIGTASPSTALDINGALSARGMSAPATAPSGQGRIYFDSTANKFKVSENAGSYTNLAGAVYVGATTATYNGAGVGGYAGGNAKCAAQFSSSRMCYSGDFATAAPTSDGWYNTFIYAESYGYAIRDCDHWTNASGPVTWWSGGQPVLGGCGNAEKILCCK